MDKEKNNASFIEKFMVRSNYEIFKFGGYTLKNKDRGMKLMLQYFSEYFIPAEGHPAGASDTDLVYPYRDCSLCDFTCVWHLYSKGRFGSGSGAGASGAGLFYPWHLWAHYDSFHGAVRNDGTGKVHAVQRYAALLSDKAVSAVLKL